MIEQYELYCLADPFFYDTADRQPAGHAEFDRPPVPDGWRHSASDTWMYYAPEGVSLPAQGWKVHVSARLADAGRVIAAVWDHCVRRGLAFKFLRSPAVVMMLNSKAAFRGSSGKLVTIYPPDEDSLRTVLDELGALLRGVPGPYILSDLRYGDGPMFVRYGGFTERHCLNATGERVLALADDRGDLVPDVRGPVFSLPPWVELPEFLAPHLAARNAVTTAGLPYEIESVVQFSNGGGVYLGRDLRTQRHVILKEARPHAGLDVAGRDAVARLGHERDILARLAGLSAVPALLDYFTLGEHHFLVEEFVDGNPLQRLLVQRYPLTHPDVSAETLAEYTAWALSMIARVERAAASLHGRGVVFGDLHPDNVLVTADGRCVLIDFEVAMLAADHARADLAHPGYGPPRDRRGVDVDRYALACLHLGMFAPQTTIVLPLDRAKVVQLADLVAEAFPVPRAAMDRAVRTILGDDVPAPVRAPAAPMPGDATWPEVRAAMSRAILASATPDRDDRLFPGDIRQFRPGGGVNLAHGAAGVLYALAATGAGRYPRHEDWLRKRALSPAYELGTGFYDGRHGIAHVLEALGHRQDALDTVDLALRDTGESLELGLSSGLAGIGLNLLDLGTRTGERHLIDVAYRIVDTVADRLGGPEDVPAISGGDHPHAGLMLGSAGPALLFLRAYEHGGDATLLDHAATALRQDLRRCVRAEDGTLQVNQGWRTLPYLDEGSVGIALVLARHLGHRDDEDLAAALDDLLGVTRAGYFVMPGLFTGRAGMIAARGMTARAAGTGPDPDTLELIRWLRWHAVAHGGGLAFPGDQLLRLSMDFATGTAGVLFALGAALHDRPVSLPFLEPADPAR
ncbi:MAG TPA: class III lanthionine synthetase LanKC [Mycobacteriales bacterium]